MPHTLLQLRVLCLGFFQDRDVGVGVFPEGDKCWNKLLLRQPHLPHQLGEPRVGTYGVEQKISFQIR
jgi:hypothetical protein